MSGTSMTKPKTTRMAARAATPVAVVAASEMAGAHDGAGANAPGDAAAPAVTRVGYAPIVRVDPERREIELCATSEALDAHGTVFSYEASRDAFTRWAGNVREMHERKAIGRRVAVRGDDERRRIYVRIRISRGAQDTWEKVLDGTLAGASIGASNVEWRTEHRKTADGTDRDVPVARRYDLVELSLVDLPSNPDALGVTFVRDGVPLPEILDEIEDASVKDGETRAEDRPANHAATDRPAVADLRAATGDERGDERIDDRALMAHEEPPEVRIAREALAAGRAQIARWEDTPLPWTAADLALAESSVLAHSPQTVADPSASPAQASLPAPSASPRAARLAALGAPGYAAPADPPSDAASSPPSPARVAVLVADSPLLAGEGLGVRSVSPPPALSVSPSATSVPSVVNSSIFRVADGVPFDEGEVPLARRQAGEYVGAVAVRAVEGIPGQGLTPDRAWSARTVDLLEQGRVLVGPGARLQDPPSAPDSRGALPSDSPRPAGRGAGGEDLSASPPRPSVPSVSSVVNSASSDLPSSPPLCESLRVPSVSSAFSAVNSSSLRARGAFSDNPDGPPDVGVPARAEERPTAALGQTPAGNAAAVFHTAARAILTGCGCPACQGALALLDDNGDARPGSSGATGMDDGTYGRHAAAVVTRVLTAHTHRLDDAIGGVRAGVDRLADALGGLDRRLAAVEAQPMPGGPQLRVADKTHALAPAGGYGGHGDIGAQLRALESLAGRLSDPQAQIAIATEMIRLQQEAAGLPAAYQVMPRAGLGSGGVTGGASRGAEIASRRGA